MERSHQASAFRGNLMEIAACEEIGIAVFNPASNLAAVWLCPPGCIRVWDERMEDDGSDGTV